MVDAAGTLQRTNFFGTRQGTNDLIGLAQEDFTDDAAAGVPQNSLPVSSNIVLNKVDPHDDRDRHQLRLHDDRRQRRQRQQLTSPTSARRDRRSATIYPRWPTAPTTTSTPSLAGGRLRGDNGRLFLSTHGRAAGSLTRSRPYERRHAYSVVFDTRAQAGASSPPTQLNLWGTHRCRRHVLHRPDEPTSRRSTSSGRRQHRVHLEQRRRCAAGRRAEQRRQRRRARWPPPIATPPATSSNWRAFGFGLPNTIVNQLIYNPTVDVLAVSLFGRGAWLLYDVTTYFPTATRAALRPGRQRFRAAAVDPDQRQSMPAATSEKVRLRHAHHRRHDEPTPARPPCWAGGLRPTAI